MQPMNHSISMAREKSSSQYYRKTSLFLASKSMPFDKRRFLLTSRENESLKKETQNLDVCSLDENIRSVCPLIASE